MSGAARSQRAFAHYRELVVEANAAPIKLCVALVLTEAEHSWSDLTPLESWVFGIDPALLNALVFAHVRYEDMIGCTDVEFETFRAEERAGFPHCFRGERLYAMDDAITFMVEACELPFEQAAVWVCRAIVQNVRSGLFNAPCKAPIWAYGDIEPARATGSRTAFAR